MVRAECGSLNLLATGGRGGELTMGGDPVSFNQRVVGSIPTALTIEPSEKIDEMETLALSAIVSILGPDPQRTCADEKATRLAHKLPQSGDFMFGAAAGKL
jgi:hypothetical protein